jgi:hypothetical protein
MGGRCCSRETLFDVNLDLPNSGIALIDGNHIELRTSSLPNKGLGLDRPNSNLEIQPYEKEHSALGRTSEPQTRTPQSVSGSVASLSQFARITSLSLVTSMNAVAPASQKLLDRYPTPCPVSQLPGPPPGFDESLPESGPWLVHPFKATYFGQTECDVPHGFGRLVTSKGAILEGFFNKGELTGYARIIEQSGQMYAGGFKNKRKHGQGMFVDKMGQVINAVWEQGVTNGPIQVVDQHGKLVFRGTTIQGKRHGYGVEWNPFEKYTYEGDFENDNYHGHGSKIYEDGRAYTGGFRNGIEHGEGVLVKVDGRILKGKFEAGLPKGEILQISESKKEKIVQY